MQNRFIQLARDWNCQAETVRRRCCKCAFKTLKPQRVQKRSSSVGQSVGMHVISSLSFGGLLLSRAQGCRTRADLGLNAGCHNMRRVLLFPARARKPSSASRRRFAHTQVFLLKNAMNFGSPATKAQLLAYLAFGYQITTRKAAGNFEFFNLFGALFAQKLTNLLGRLFYV